MDVTSIRIKNLESKFENFEAFVKVFLEQNGGGDDDAPIKDLRRQITSVSDQNKRLKVLVEKQQSKMRELEKSNSALTYQVKILKEKSAECETRNSELNTEIDSVKSKLSDLEEKHSEVVAKIEGVDNVSTKSALRVIAEQALKIQELRDDREDDVQSVTTIDAPLRVVCTHNVVRPAVHKPPVIILTENRIYSDLCEAMEDINIDITGHFTCDGIKFVPNDMREYNEIVEYLHSENADFYTFNMKGEEVIRVVMRGVHTQHSPDDVLETLECMGYPVRAVRRLGNPSRDYPLVLVHLDNTSPGRMIYNLDSFMGRRVTIEQPHDPDLPFYLVKNGFYKCPSCQSSHACEDRRLAVADID